jgi:hypothetical protein
MQWRESFQAEFAEFNLPIAVGAYFAHQRLLRQAQAVAHLKRQETTMKLFNWKHLILLAFAIPVVYQLAGYFGGGAARNVSERKAASSPPQISNDDIRVVVSSQDSEGVTQQNFDMHFLKNLEAYTVERVKLKAKEFLASQGHPNAQLDISSEAIYCTVCTVLDLPNRTVSRGVRAVSDLPKLSNF